MPTNQEVHSCLQETGECASPASRIGLGLRRLREILGFSQSELARAAHVNLSYICSIENHPCNISIRKLMQLCNAMHISACISLRLAALSGEQTSLRDRLSAQWHQYLPTSDPAFLRVADAGPSESPDRPDRS